MFQYLLAISSIDIIAGNFNYDLLKVSENKLLNISTDHVQMVNKLTHIWILTDYVYVEKTLMVTFSIIVTIKHIYFLDHDAIRILTEQNNVDFQ